MPGADASDPTVRQNSKFAQASMTFASGRQLDRTQLPANMGCRMSQLLRSAPTRARLLDNTLLEHIVRDGRDGLERVRLQHEALAGALHFALELVLVQALCTPA